MFLEQRLGELRRAAGADDAQQGEDMPLETKDPNDPKRLVKVRFIRNTAEDGENYGPDYPKKTAQVPFHRAATYIRQGRAEAVSDDDALQEVEEAARAADQLPDPKKRK